MHVESRTLLLEICKERYSLERFAKPHLIRQDSIDTVVMELDHPIQTYRQNGTLKHDIVLIFQVNDLLFSNM